MKQTHPLCVVILSAGLMVYSQPNNHKCFLLFKNPEKELTSFIRKTDNLYPVTIPDYGSQEAFLTFVFYHGNHSQCCLFSIPPHSFQGVAGRTCADTDICCCHIARSDRKPQIYKYQRFLGSSSSFSGFGNTGTS